MCAPPSHRRAAGLAWLPRAGARLVAALVMAATLLLVPRAARAQDRVTLAGAWSASALTEAWAIGDWGDKCGPRPAPQGAGGGAVQIREQGNELSISGAGRSFSTAQCWEQMPGLARTSHSASGGGRFWRTRCSTGANDSRQATVITTIQATDSSISLNETGQYQFVIEGQNCTASVTRARTFSLVKRDEAAPAASATAAPSAAPPPSAPAPAPPPPAPVAARPPPRCSGPGGDPARLEVYPGKKLLRAGDRFAFRAAVLDADGCPVGQRPSWSILPGPLAAKATVDPSGAVTVAADAPEGKLELSASLGGKGVTVPIQVASSADYDALLAASGLDDAGDGDQAAVAVIAAGTIGGKLTVAEDVARERKIVFVAIVGAVAAALGFFGLILVRRGRAAAVQGAGTGESVPPVEDEGGEAPAPEPPVAVPPRAAAKPVSRGKICPTCGALYPPEAGFCGKDATVLVPVN